MNPRQVQILYVLTGPLVLTIPLISFLNHAAYPLQSPEAILSLLIFAGAGFLSGLLMLKGGLKVRLLVCATLITAFVDLQFGWPRLPYAVVGIIGTVAVLWLIREHLIQVVFTFFCIVFILTLLTPASGFWSTDTGTHKRPVDRSLPPIFHIIFDEHIGIESIPLSADPERSSADFISMSYLDMGFRVYSRAYSISDRTRISIPLALDTATDQDASRANNRYRHVLSDDPGYSLSKLHDRGYKINVVQSRYMDFCQPGGKSIADQCHTYDYGNISAIHGEPSRPLMRLGYILESIRHSSKIYQLSAASLGSSERVAVGPTSSIAAMRGIEAFTKITRNAQRGNVYFAHLLIPHKPYSYAADCSIQNVSRAWPSAEHRYKQYLAQTRCVTHLISELFKVIDEEAGLNDAIILVHGDHGSRLDSREYTSMSSFGTLLAISIPGLAGELDRTPVSVQHIIRSVLSKGTVPENASHSEVPETHEKGPLKPFAYGQPVKYW